MRKAVFVALFLCTALAAPAAAHERRELGPIELTVGWLDEPAFVGLRNAVSVRVERDGRGIEGLADRLQLVVSLGETGTGKFRMRPVFDDPGHYLADLLPTAPGAFVFHVRAEIDGDRIDETFEAGEDTFDEVREAGDIAFPGVAPSNSTLFAAIEQLSARIDAVENRADLTRIFALAALVLAAVSLVATIVRRRAG